MSDSSPPGNRNPTKCPYDPTPAGMHGTNCTLPRLGARPLGDLTLAYTTQRSHQVAHRGDQVTHCHWRLRTHSAKAAPNTIATGSRDAPSRTAELPFHSFTPTPCSTSPSEHRCRTLGPLSRTQLATWFSDSQHPISPSASHARPYPKQHP